MSAHPTPSSQAPDGIAEDFARAALEDQLAGLKRLAAVGLEIVEGLAVIVARQVAAGEPDRAFDAPAFSLAYDRAARAVRMSYALQHTVLDRLRHVERIELNAAEDARRARLAEAQARQAAAEAPANARKAQIAKALTDIIADAHEDDSDGYDGAIREASERLRDPDVFADVLGRPASEIIAAICRGLGLEANWQGLAAEAWALEEVLSGKVGEPLRSPPLWTGKGLGRSTRAPVAQTPAFEPPDAPAVPPIAEEPQEAEIIKDPPPPAPRPDPDALPGYPVGLPGELPPPRPPRRSVRRYN